MKLPAISLARVFVLFLAFSGLLIADAPPLLTTGVEIGSSNERTALSRTTRKLSSTVDVKIKNTSDRLLEAPLHAVISFTPLNGGNLAGLTMPGALGGVGVAPYQTFYKDLSASIGNGLAVGAETTFSFTFERPEGTTVSYAVAIRGIRNNDPNGLIGGPYSGQQGTPVTFDASNSTDPDGEALTFSWDFGDGSTGTGAKPQHAYSTTGLFSVVVTVSDPRGAVVTRETQVPISPPGAFALARTRTLDGNGHPLGTVAVTQSGPDGSRTFQSDAVSGFTSLGGQPGDHTWSFAREGYLTSFRETTLDQGVVKVVSFPWLAPLNASRTTLSLLNPTSVKSPAERVTLTVPPEAFEQVVSVALTDLHGQNLPLPLPFGWSPLVAFHLDAPATSAADIAASVKLLQAVPPSRPLVLVHLATATPAWLAESLPTSTGGDTLAVLLRKPGSYAVVIADTLPAGNPALAQAGEPLPAGAAAVVAPEVTAAGVVNPAATVASLDPARVTATATVDFTNGTQPLASGAWFLADVEETYDLRDGQAFKTPDYDATFYAYQTPGDASASTATASFPLRPRILFGPDQLTEANLKLDVLALNQFSGGIVTQDGGLLSMLGLRIGIPAGAVAGPSATEIRLISTANLSRFLGEFQPLLAFEINLPRLADGTSLDFSITQKLAPDSHFVLARCVNSGSESGLQPVLRLRSDSQGVVTTNEPASGPRLPGITGSGQFVVVKITAPQALITGLVRKVGGALLPAAIVRVSAEPWLSFTGGAGTFSTLAKPGERNVTGSDPTDGNSGQATASLADAASVANVEIQTAATGPRVVATTPAANDTKASKVAPIIVEFSEPIQPGSFGANGIRLLDVAANVDVPGSLSLDLSNRKATLLPLNPLNNAKDYQIIVSNAILDRQNLPIGGTLTFPFKTAPSDERPAGAQLVIYEPGADAIPPAILDLLVAYDSAEGSSHVVAHGSPGTADPEVPVILVNQNTGETATVLSKPDGSFADFINAAEEDFIEAVFVNANGTRVIVPATRQIFDNGQIGLYKYGGILEAENAEPGTAQILVEPATIEERVKFKVDTVALQRILEALDGTVPEGGQMLGGIVASHENAAGVEGSADVVFAVDPAALQLPAGITKPEDATFLLTSVQEVDGVTVFEVLDTMQYADGKLRTASPPFPGLTFLDAAGKVLSKTLKGGEKSSFASKSLGKSNKILAQLGLPSLQDTVTHQLLLPILMAQGTTSRVVGRVVAQAVDENGEPRGEAQPVGGAVIGVEPPPFTGSGLRPGAVIAQSDATGKFALRVDVGLQGGAFRLAATHPRFPHQVALSFLTVGSLAERFTGAAGDLNSSFLLANVALNKLKFIIPPAPGTVGEDELSPRVRAAHTPVLPLAGLGADAGVALSAAGIDERAVVSLTVRVLEAEAASGQALSPDTEILLTETAVAQPAPGLLEKQFRLQCARAGRVRLELRAADDAGNVTTVEHVVDFGRVPLITGTGDGTLPLRVLSVWPPPGSTGHAAFPELTLRFNKPVPPELLAPGATDWLTFAQGYYVTALEPGLDRREVRLRFAGPPRGDVAVTVGSPLVDANGEAFDQNPDIDGAQSFAWSFGLAAPDVATLGLQRGGGTALLGATLFALDRKSPNGPGELVVYDVADPTNPKRIAAITVMEDPSDLALLPAYSVVPRPGALPTTRNLVAVIGGGFGDFSEQGNGVGFKNLRLIDVTSPSSPTVFATGNVGFDPTSRIHKLVAVPPFLGYLEASADVTGIHLVDIAAFVLGRNASAQERAFFPINPEFGLDLNGDGDFVDAGEKNSEAERSPAKFFGDFYSFAPIHSAERVVDFSLGNGALLGAISTFPAGGAAMYRNLVTGADPADPEVGAYRFGVREDPKRVTVLTEVAIRVAGEIRILDLALVSLRAAANGQPALAVLDLSNPQRPVRLGDMPLAPTDGIPQTLTRRNDGQLALAVTNGTLLLDPLRLLEKDAQGRSLAVTGRVDGTGGGTRAFVADGSGLVASGGGAGQILFQGPGFDLLTFKEAPIPASAWAVLPTSEQERRLAAALPVRQVRAAGVRFGGTPEAPVPSVPNPLNHYYVLCHVPGGAGGLVPPGTIDLSAASVTSAGKLPGVNATNTLPHLLADPASRRALLNGLPDATTSFPTRLTAHRLSNDPLSAFYNLFLAGPLTTHRALGATEAAALTSQLPRAMLHQDAALYIGLAPQANGVSDGFLNPYRPALQAGTLRAAEGLYLETDRVRNPLIFVPGVLASKLRGNRIFDLWLSLPNIATDVVFRAAKELLTAGAFRKNLSKDDLGATGGAGNFLNATADLVLGPEGEGKTVMATDVLRSVGVSIQQPLLDFLTEEMGYREYLWDRDAKTDFFSPEGKPNWDSLATQPDLFPFPYDWRLGIEVNALRLQRYIDLILQAHPDAEAVDVLAHSMGGLVARRAMLVQPGRIATLISVSSPYLGAPKALNAIKSGDLGETSLNVAIGTELSRQIARHMPALHQLLPTRSYFELGGRPLAEKNWDGDGQGQSVGSLNYDGYRSAVDGPLFHDPFLTTPRPIAQHNEPLHGSNVTGNIQDDWRADTIGTRIVHLVVAQQQPATIAQLRMEPRLLPTDPVPDVGLGLTPVNFWDSEQVLGSDSEPPEDGESFPYVGQAFRLEYGVELVRGPGDGTVPLLSQARGFGSPASLNAPGTVMIPLISPDAGAVSESAFSHVGVLANPKLFTRLREVLENGTAALLQPTLELELSEAGEGEAVEYNVTILNGPAEEPTVVWDFGDGGMAVGAKGRRVFPESGTFTVTCAVDFATGVGAVASAQVTITNKAPVVTLLADRSAVARAETVRFIATGFDPGSEDGIHYSWDFGDGTTLEGSSPIVTHVFSEDATRVVKVTARDDEGAETTSSTTITIGGPAISSRAQLVASTRPEVMDDPGLVDFVYLTIAGHDQTGAGMPQINQGGELIDEALGVIVPSRGVQYSGQGKNGIEIRIPRQSPTGRSPPASSLVKMQATGTLLEIEALHHRKDGQVGGYRWFVNTQPGEDVTLTIAWDELPNLTDLNLLDATAPKAALARRVDPFDLTAPMIVTEPTLAGYRLTGQDYNTGGAGTTADSTLVDEAPVFTVESPPDSETAPDTVPGDNVLPALDEQTLPEGAIITEVQGLITQGTEPTEVLAVLSQDKAGNVGGVTTNGLVRETERVPPEMKERLKDIVREVITDATGNTAFKTFVLHLNDVLLFEQGSGAAVWKDNNAKLAGFDTNSSDRDFEIFFPLWKYGVSLADSKLNLLPNTNLQPAGKNLARELAWDHDDPTMQAEFLRMAHIPDVMRGNWYFRAPIGLDESGADMGEVPDPSDSEDYQRYLTRVAKWRYVLPPRVKGTLAGEASEVEDIRGLPGDKIFVVDVPRGEPVAGEDESIFEHPVTPAQVIAFVFTQMVALNKEKKLAGNGVAFTKEQIAERRNMLKDVTFFPFRRDHFEAGVLSLEKPPEFGSDPLGDAATGRTLLGLKWVLEGAFLPPFAGFNQGIDDQAMRAAIYERIKTRSLATTTALEAEGYEWGLFQEFALLRESAQLRMQRVAAAGEGRRGVFGDYVTSHEKKILKKVGKAALRSMAARLGAENAHRAALFTVNPRQFDADSNLVTYEHFIATLVSEPIRLALFGGLSREEVQQYLQAKIGNQTFLNALAEDYDAATSFIERGFAFIARNVQEETEDDFEGYRKSLDSLGVPWERLQREENVHDIEHGFGDVSGRLTMHAVLPIPYEAEYPFAVHLFNTGTVAVNGVGLSLSSAGEPPIRLDDLTVPGRLPGRLDILAKDAEGDPLFTVRRDVTSAGTRQHTFEVFGLTPTNDHRKSNNVTVLESDLLELDEHVGVSFPGVRGNRVVYRGRSLDAEGVRQFINNELVRGVELSSAIRAGATDTSGTTNEERVQVIVEDMALRLETELVLNPAKLFSGHSAEDIVRMNEDEKAMLAHTSVTFPDDYPSAGISTSHSLLPAIGFAGETEDSHLLVYEVPRASDEQFAYLPSRLDTPDGQIVPRCINDLEQEITFLGSIRFRRAWLYNFAESGLSFYGAKWELKQTFEGAP